MQRLVAAMTLLTVLAGCSGNVPSGADACSSVSRGDVVLSANNHTAVALATSDGCMVVEVYDDVVPMTAANFKTYVRDGFYTDMRWHRIDPGFVSQTGAFLRSGTEKTATHPAIPNESGKALAHGLHNDLYTVAAARDPSNPNSATSQFFINAGKGSHGTENRALDASNATATDGFCVFAVLVSGQRVADRINNNTSTVDPPILVAARILT